MRTVEHVMGLPVTFDLRDDDLPPEALTAAVDWLRWVDATFSTYRADSQIARLNRGELREDDADPRVREVLTACRALRERTGGAFDAEAAARMPAARERPGCGGGRPGTVESAGYVKGWAVREAWERLVLAGARNGLIDAGGDVLAHGHPAPGARWRVGIQHPVELDRLAAVLEVQDLAVATSGTYRRGEHIVDPATGAPPRGVRSVSCVGPDLAIADALATAAFAMGPGGAPWLARQGDVEAMVIDDRDRVHLTPGFAALRV
ncbi:MAG: FAD:protein FMN transferase [Solirubrobacteraceae bacterium]